MIEGKDSAGYVWIHDERNGEYYYLKDFEHLVVMKVTDHWEATVFEDEGCHQVIGRQEFATMREAQENLEQLMEVIIKNRNKPNN